MLLPAWKPGNGIDPKALKRLQSFFDKPTQPMGEAWFLAEERKMFTYLLGDIERLDTERCAKAIEEIYSGLSCFGHLDEWIEWYDYLLPQLTPRAHEDDIFEYLSEHLITGFMLKYPNGIHQEPYLGFKDDVLSTLGQYLMSETLWENGKVRVGTMLWRDNHNPNKFWFWWDASGDFSASMFFRLKYLESKDIKEWTESLLSIDCAHWRAQLIVWIVGAYKILTNEIQQPAQLKQENTPSVCWAGYNYINKSAIRLLNVESNVSNIIPDENRQAFLQVLSENLNEATLMDWLKQISDFDYLERELGNIPMSLFEIIKDNWNQIILKSS